MFGTVRKDLYLEALAENDSLKDEVAELKITEED